MINNFLPFSIVCVALAFFFAALGYKTGDPVMYLGSAWLLVIAAIAGWGAVTIPDR